MLQHTISALIARELRTLERELAAYPDEASIWALPPGAPNSAGTLALHLVGNLQHFVGARLGGTGYVRDRDAEFATRGVPRAELVPMIEETIAVVERSLAAVSDDALGATYPQALGKWTAETGDFLAHLAVHLAYHLGQVDYHRRLVTGNAAGVDAVPLGGMRSARPIAAP
jgi:hypothetical protein